MLLRCYLFPSPRVSLKLIDHFLRHDFKRSARMAESGSLLYVFMRGCAKLICLVFGDWKVRKL